MPGVLPKLFRKDKVIFYLINNCRATFLSIATPKIINMEKQLGDQSQKKLKQFSMILRSMTVMKMGKGK